MHDFRSTSLKKHYRGLTSTLSLVIHVRLLFASIITRTDIHHIPGLAVVCYEVRVQERVSWCGDITYHTGASSAFQDLGISLICDDKLLVSPYLMGMLSYVSTSNFRKSQETTLISLRLMFSILPPAPTF